MKESKEADSQCDVMSCEQAASGRLGHSRCISHRLWQFLEFGKGLLEETSELNWGYSGKGAPCSLKCQEDYQMN